MPTSAPNAGHAAPGSSPAAGKLGRKMVDKDQRCGRRADQVQLRQVAVLCGLAGPSGVTFFAAEYGGLKNYPYGLYHRMGSASIPRRRFGMFFCAGPSAHLLGAPRRTSAPPAVSRTSGSSTRPGRPAAARLQQKQPRRGVRGGCAQRPAAWVPAPLRTAPAQTAREVRRGGGTAQTARQTAAPAPRRRPRHPACRPLHGGRRRGGRPGWGGPPRKIRRVAGRKVEPAALRPRLAEGAQVGADRRDVRGGGPVFGHGLRATAPTPRRPSSTAAQGPRWPSSCQHSATMPQPLQQIKRRRANARAREPRQQQRVAAEPRAPGRSAPACRGQGSLPPSVCPPLCASAIILPARCRIPACRGASIQ